jgi:hypothetical protein
METVYCLEVTPPLLFGNYVRQALIINTLGEGRQAQVIGTYPPRPCGRNLCRFANWQGEGGGVTGVRGAHGAQ